MKTPEEVKKGLECCNTFYNCQQCPYDRDEEGWSRVIERNSDALALIRQLEAKLAEYEKPLVPMTWEDAIINDSYLEIKGDEYVDMALNDVAADDPDGGFIRYTTHWSDSLYLYRRKYGKTWRCWSRKPTDEERKAAKWDECG